MTVGQVNRVAGFDLIFDGSKDESKHEKGYSNNVSSHQTTLHVI